MSENDKRAEHLAVAPDYRAVMRGLLQARREANPDAAQIINEAIRNELSARFNTYAELIAADPGGVIYAESGSIKLCGESHRASYVTVTCVVPLPVKHRIHVSFDPAGRLISWGAK